MSGDSLEVISDLYEQNLIKNAVIEKLEAQNKKLRETLEDIGNKIFTDFDEDCECPGHAIKVLAEINEELSEH